MPDLGGGGGMGNFKMPNLGGGGGMGNFDMNKLKTPEFKIPGGQGFQSQFGGQFKMPNMGGSSGGGSSSSGSVSTHNLGGRANSGLNKLNSILGRIMTCDPGSEGAKPVTKVFSLYGRTQPYTVTTPRYSYGFLSKNRN